jgi:hypothetical protein
MQMEQAYQITPDSLIITGKADYGRSNVDYLLRTNSAKEQKLMVRNIEIFSGG